jgi:1-acyl-sn-glycerol-3-phosphate acyltransferase
MSLARYIAGNIWRIWFFTNAVLCFLFFFPLVVLFISREKWFPIVFKLIKCWAYYCLWVSGIRYHITSEAKLNPNVAYIFCPNHSSILDIIVSYVAIPQYFHFMGKAELTKIPLFKIFFKRMNISVDRSSLKASYGAYQRAHDDLQKGISIGIFPEATIPDCTPKLGPMKNGAFKLAIENQIAIVPITYVNTWKIMPDIDKTCGGKPGTVFIYLHQPIATKGMTAADLKTLREATAASIESKLGF